MIKPKKTHVSKGQKTNKTKDSLVKVVVLEDIGKWVQPASGQKFYIDEDATFPSIVFEIETPQDGPYDWSWSISWAAAVSGIKVSAKRGKVLKTFSLDKSFKSDSKSWKVDLSQLVLGGLLTVKVKTSEETFKRSVFILGKNPGEDRVKKYLDTIDNVKGFEKLLAQESHFKNFIIVDGYPITAFDGGYGLTQMTHPSPTFEQVWNWKKNIDGGAALYKEKQKSAKQYLSKKNRTYTDEQLKLETWSLWNGGNYHVWDEQTKSWIRNPNILDDTQTGNIGWDVQKNENKGKTENELHDRDKEQYKKPPKSSERLWMYSEVSYADHVNK